MKICSICKDKIDVEGFSGWADGHNAQPINNGRCCSNCNNNYVIPCRLSSFYSRQENKGEK